MASPGTSLLPGYRHAARDLAHRCEQRQLSGGQLDRLVRDRDRPRLDARSRKRFIGGKVEVREEDLALAHERPLGFDGLLYFHEHLSTRPHFVGGLEYHRTGVLIEVVGEAAARPGALFNEDLMASLREHLSSRWR